MHKIFNSYTRKKFWIFSYIQKQDQVNNANSAFISTAGALVVITV